MPKGEEIDTYVAEESEDVLVDEATLDYFELTSPGDKAMVFASVPIPNPANGTISWIKVARVVSPLPDENSSSMEDRAVVQMLSLLGKTEENVKVTVAEMSRRKDV